MLCLRPVQPDHGLVGPLGVAVVNLPVRIERAAKYLFITDNQPHKLCRSVPTIHQHVAELQPPVQGAQQHITHMVELGLTISIWVIDAVVDDPELIVDRVRRS